MAAEMVRALAEKLAIGHNVKTRVCVVRNRTFGESVTTAGLLAGKDVLAALRKEPPADLVVLPATALRRAKDFLTA